MQYNQLQQQWEIPIYNPKLNNKPYFKFKNWPYRNPECEITEEEYERLCEIKWINPIYPKYGTMGKKTH